MKVATIQKERDRKAVSLERRDEKGSIKVSPREQQIVTWMPFYDRPCAYKNCVAAKEVFSINRCALVDVPFNPDAQCVISILTRQSDLKEMPQKDGEIDRHFFEISVYGLEDGELEKIKNPSKDDQIYNSEVILWGTSHRLPCPVTGCPFTTDARGLNLSHLNVCNLRRVPFTREGICIIRHLLPQIAG